MAGMPTCHSKATIVSVGDGISVPVVADAACLEVTVDRATRIWWGLFGVIWSFSSQRTQSLCL